MPIYGYKCQKCGTESEILVHSNAQPCGLQCPTCGSKKLDRLLSVPSLVKTEARASGGTCCGREERCDTPQCSSGEGECCRS